METIFDLRNLKRFAERSQFKAVIIVDTNIFMDHPEFKEWKTDIGETLWVVYELIGVEIHRLKNDQRDKEVKRKADKARGKLTELNLTGKQKGSLIIDGFRLDNGQSFISVAKPAKSELAKISENYPEFVKSFGDDDLNFVWLTMYIYNLMQNIPVIFCSADKGLVDSALLKGINACLFSQADAFPLKIKGSPWVTPKKIDWDLEIQNIEKELQKTAIPVELTLVSRIQDPDNSNQMLAEGTGVIRGSYDIHFEWEMPFSQIKYLLSDGGVEWSWDITSDPALLVPDPVLNFSEQDTPPNPDIIDSIKDVIARSVYPSSFGDTVITLQDPVSTTKQWLQQHMDNEKLAKVVESSKDDEELFNTCLDILYEEHEFNEYRDLIVDLIDDHHRYWNLGQLYEFNYYPPLLEFRTVL